MLEFLTQGLEALRAERRTLQANLDAVLAPATIEKRNLTADEGARFDEARAAVLAKDAEIEAQEKRIAEQEQIEKRRDAAKVVETEAGEKRTGSAVITSEPSTYASYTKHSYYLDLVRSELNRGDGDGGVQAARERLQRHAREIEVEFPKREARRAKAAETELRGHGYGDRAVESAFERRTNPNRTDGQGGYFVPPLWLIDEYINLPRFGRATANLCQNLTLPGGTDSINLPKVATGTAVAVQTADAASVNSTDMTDTTVSASVKTVAGQQDIALQLLDQSPIAFDQVIFADLTADLNQKIDVQVISGSGSSGQVTGILNTSSINSITYTDASPTLPEMWPSLLQAASQVAKNRKAPASAVVMTPSIWYWMLSQLDSSNRPFIVPNGVAFNPMGSNGAPEFEGPAGMLTYGLPVYLDGNIPSNLGGSTNETRVITARFSDLYLWEGAPRTRVLQEVLSGTLQVRLQIWEYLAFMANRRPEAISVGSGTGYVPASGY